MDLKAKPSVPEIIAVIPIHNGLPYVLDAIDSILSQRDSSFQLQVVVAACGSTDSSVEVIQKKFPEVIIALGEDGLWWTGAMQLGSAKALELGADYVFWMNHDDVLGPSTISRLLQYCLKNVQTIACSVLASPDGVSAVCGFRIHHLRWYSEPKVFSLKETQLSEFQLEVDVNGGHGILIPREVFGGPEKMGVLSPLLFPHYSGDFDFFMRARRQNFKVVTVGGTYICNNPKTTGILQGQRIQKFSQIRSYLFSRRSPCNLRDRPLFAATHFPFPFKIIWPFILVIVPILCAVFYQFRRSKLGPLDWRPSAADK